jgi:protein O-GlcNAc transferase
MDALRTALDLFQRGRSAEAEAVCRNVLERAADRRDALRLLADMQLASGRTVAAVGNFEMLAALDPGDTANLRRLGGALLALGHLREAVAVLERAVRQEPDNERALNNLGQAFLKLQDIPQALQCFERALAVNSSYAIAHHNRGAALFASGDLEAALAAFQSAISHDANLSAARLQAAVVLEALGRAEPALEYCEAILRSRPLDAVALIRKASALLMLGRAEDALEAADRALESQADVPDALIAKAGALCRLNRPAEALRCLERLLALHPGHVEGWCSRAIAHQQLGQDAESIACYRQALSLDPHCLRARTGLLSGLIPSIPLHAAEESDGRGAFEQELGAFESWLAPCDLVEIDAWELAKQQFFYLSYQEECNKGVLQRYRTLAAERLSCAVPLKKAPPLVSGTWPRCLRLGIVSAHVFEHSVYRAIVAGWLQQLDGNDFEITVFSLGSKRDQVTQNVRDTAAHFECDMRSPAEWARLIRGRSLDAMIFPEVGLDRTTLALAGLRLAPRQFASWGHPETTGLPTIDAYLSAELLEPSDAEGHYSERLIKLPQLGVYFQPRGIAAASQQLADFGIGSGGPVLVCAGTPFKYRPEDDGVWVDIARRLKQCTFVFFQHERLELSNKLRLRLAAAFARAGLDAERFMVWLPWQPRAAFLSILRQADLYLDTIGFSGFNTFMQAVEAGLPCVSYEGRYLRGRLGSGILRRLGLPGLIAASRSEYVDIAVRLVEEPALRASMRNQMQLAEPTLYADHSAISALSWVLRQRQDFREPAV